MLHYTAASSQSGIPTAAAVQSACSAVLQGGPAGSTTPSVWLQHSPALGGRGADGLLLLPLRVVRRTLASLLLLAPLLFQVLQALTCPDDAAEPGCAQMSHNWRWLSARCFLPPTPDTMSPSQTMAIFTNLIRLLCILVAQPCQLLVGVHVAVPVVLVFGVCRRIALRQPPPLEAEWLAALQRSKQCWPAEPVQHCIASTALAATNSSIMLCLTHTRLARSIVAM
jgi:hypothetical protein